MKFFIHCFPCTTGMGEFSVVLNGLEFRTRHNDYKMVMPSTTSGEIDAVDQIQFPDVPKSVTDQPTVDVCWFFIAHFRLAYAYPLVFLARFYQSGRKCSGATSNTRVSHFPRKIYTSSHFTPEIRYPGTTHCIGVFHSTLIKSGSEYESSLAAAISAKVTKYNVFCGVFAISKVNFSREVNADMTPRLLRWRKHVFSSYSDPPQQQK